MKIKNSKVKDSWQFRLWLILSYVFTVLATITVLAGWITTIIGWRSGIDGLIYAVNNTWGVFALLFLTPFISFGLCYGLLKAFLFVKFGEVSKDKSLLPKMIFKVGALFTTLMLSIAFLSIAYFITGETQLQKPVFSPLYSRESLYDYTNSVHSPGKRNLAHEFREKPGEMYCVSDNSKPIWLTNDSLGYSLCNPNISTDTELVEKFINSLPAYNLDFGLAENIELRDRIMNQNDEFGRPRICLLASDDVYECDSTEILNVRPGMLFYLFIIACTATPWLFLYLIHKKCLRVRLKDAS